MIQRIIAVVLTVVGVGLMAYAHQSAAEIPTRAEEDFGALVRAAGGSMSHTPSFPDTFKQMSVDRRLLQNGYVGGSGLVLLGAGALGLVLPAKRREA